MVGRNRVSQLETILREWLSEPAITLMCGDWRNGCIMEILPEGPVTLTREKYPEPFSGLRDIELPGQPHHLHINLDKLAQVVYAITPCVCYGYRPSFEVRFNDQETNTTAFALALRQPYLGRKTNRSALIAYFRRLLDHHQRFSGITRFHVDSQPAQGKLSAHGWEEILDCFVAAGGSDSFDRALFPNSNLSNHVPSFEEHAHV